MLWSSNKVLALVNGHNTTGANLTEDQRRLKIVRSHRHPDNGCLFFWNTKLAWESREINL